MRLLISGYRYFTNLQTIEAEILKILPKNEKHTIIHGNCQGVDLTADQIAQKNGWERQVFPADWSIGKKAGPIRNQKMIEEGKPDMALLFMSENSRGTLDMKNRLERQKIKYVVINI